MLKLLRDHLLPALAIGLICTYHFGNWKLVGVALLTGWMIDVDHLVDFLYFLFRRRDTLLDLMMVTSGKYFKSNGKVIVPFHSWELALLWAIYWMSVGDAGIAVTGALAWATHLLHDQLSYRVIPMGYFFSYRAYRHFAHLGFCRG